MYNKMVIYSSRQLDHVFNALRNPTRRAILDVLARGQQTVLELASLFSISQPAVTKHLNVLESAGLIERKKDGRQRYCSLTPGALSDATSWIEQTRQHWDERLEALERYLEEDQEIDHLEDGS